MKRQPHAYLLALIAVLLWSTIATAFKISLESMDVFQLIAISSIISLLFFAIWLSTKSQWKLLLKSSRNDIFRSAIMGFLNPFLYYAVLIHAYDMISAQEAMTLNYIWPIVLALLSIPVLGQKMKPIALLAMLISFAGIVLIASRGDFTSIKISNLWGDLLALSSSIAWAAYWLINMKDKRATGPKMFLNFAFGSFYALIFLLIFSDFKFTGIQSIFPAVYVGVFEMGLTFAIWLRAISLSRKTYLVAQLIFISPFLGMIWIYVFLDEKILVTTIFGFVLIVAGILIQQYFNRKTKSADSGL
jgi:drug/metabolite transporter (DMT)-like permease